MKKAVTIISVGKLKLPHWQSAVKDYVQRLERSCQIKLVTTRESSEQTPEERNRREGTHILTALERTGQPTLNIAMHEGGEQYNSIQFSDLLLSCWEKENRIPCFIIGGPYGLAPEVLQKTDKMLSLSPMTFPHELALVLLLEQLYRADNIMRGTPYHH